MPAMVCDNYRVNYILAFVSTCLEEGISGVNPEVSHKGFQQHRKVTFLKTTSFKEYFKFFI